MAVNDVRFELVGDAGDEERVIDMDKDAEATPLAVDMT